MCKSPLTDTSNVTLLREIEAEYLINKWKANYDIDIKPELKGHSKIYLYQCNETKLNFFYPFNIAGSGKLYEQLEKMPWYYMEDKWEYHEALKNLNRSDKVLEVGCGNGAFIKLGMESGLDIIGVEFNESALINAKKKGYNVVAADLNKLADSYFESMNTVCSFQVLEHVNNPKEFIESSLKLIKPNGKLILSVPNSDGYLKYLENLLLDMPPHHMHRWCHESLKNLQNLFPIKLEKTVCEPLAVYHINDYLNSYFSAYSNNRLSRIFLNQYTKIIFEYLLKMGAKKMLKGHTIYAQFIKI